MTQWRDVASVRAVTSTSARIQFAGAWFSGKQVCVEIRVTNPQRMGEPLLYTSWNMGADNPTNPTAVMAAAMGKDVGAPLRFVPVGKPARQAAKAAERAADASQEPAGDESGADESGPAAASGANERQAKLVRVGTGQTVADVLEFAAPEGEFDHLQLALRLSAIGQGDRYLGFRIPKEMIASEKPVDVVESAGSPRRPDAGSTADAAAGNSPPAMTPGTEPAPTTTEPKEETIGDLKKQIEQEFKKTKEEKDKARREQQEREKQKPAGDQGEKPESSS